MAVAAPRKPKPSSADEIARVLRIYDLLVDEIQRRLMHHGDCQTDILSVAERIAARTED